MARTAERLSSLTEDAAARVSSVLAQRAQADSTAGTPQADDQADDQAGIPDGVAVDKAAKAEAADRERRERMAALSQRLTALTEKRRQLSSHMDFYRRSLLKGNPSASSSRFSEALKELRENAGRRQKDGDGKPETMD